MNDAYYMQRKRDYILALEKLKEDLYEVEKFQKSLRRTFTESLNSFEQDLDTEIDTQMDMLNDMEVTVYKMCNSDENDE